MMEYHAKLFVGDSFHLTRLISRRKLKSPDFRSRSSARTGGLCVFAPALPSMGRRRVSVRTRTVYGRQERLPRHAQARANPDSVGASHG